MKLVEITRPSLFDAEDILKANGYQKIGQGWYGRVYWKFKQKWVLKLFDAHDFAYRRFLNVTKQFPNKHFPVTKSVVKVNEDFFGVQIEHLSPIKKENQKYLRISFEYLTSQSYDEKMKIKNQYPEFAFALDLIQKYVLGNWEDHGSWDIKTNNLMQRDDGTVVLTDPVSGGTKYSS